MLQVLTTPAQDVNVSRDGTRFLYMDLKGFENAWRKHHTSSITRDVWLYDSASCTHRIFTTFAGEDRNPVFADNDSVFYYLSEEGGSFNVRKMGLAGGPSTQVTSFTNIPVRFLSIADDGTLCFGFDGELYTKKGDAAPRKVAVTIAAGAKSNNTQVLPVTGGAREMAVSPSGKEVAFIHRGEVFVTSVNDGVTKQITHTPEQENGVTWSPDGNALVYASERGQRWAIDQTRRTRDAEPYFYASTVLKETPLVANEHENYQPLLSPDGKQLAYVEDRMTLKILDLATKQARTLLTSAEPFSNSETTSTSSGAPTASGSCSTTRSPASRPVRSASSEPTARARCSTSPRAASATGARSGYRGGQAMMWFSNRDGLRAVAQSGGAQYDVYAMFFTRKAWDRFRLSKAEYDLVKEAEEKAAKAKADVAKKAEGAETGGARGAGARPRRPRPAQGAAHHPLLVARRRRRQQGRRDALLPRPLREGHEPRVYLPSHEGDEDAGGPQRQPRPAWNGTRTRRTCSCWPTAASRRLIRRTASASR